MSYQIDPDFHLTPEQRARVRPDFDLEALERLVSVIPAAAREDFLRLFRRTQPGEPAPLLLDLEEPELQEMLDAVFAPRWEAYSDEELIAASSPAHMVGSAVPGRTTVMRRRGLLPSSGRNPLAAEPDGS